MKRFTLALLLLAFCAPAFSQTVSERRTALHAFIDSRSDAQIPAVEQALIPLGYVPPTGPPDPPPPVATVGPRYPVGPQTYFTSNGTDRLAMPADAITINVGDNWQTKINAAPAGAKFRIKTGTHVRQVISPRSDQQFWGEPGAIMDGQGISSKAVQGNSSNVLLRNLTITNYRNPQQDGMIGNLPNSMIENCDISRSYGFGVRVGKWMRRTKVHHCAQGGLSSYFTNGAEVSDCDFSYDNENGAISGGTTAKIWNTKNMVIQYSYFHDMPRTVGLWADANNIGGDIHHNLFENIGKSGIYWEISYSAKIHDNVIRKFNQMGDDYAGVRLQNSQAVEIYNNTISDGYAGIQYASSERSNPRDETAGDWVTRNNYSHHNSISRCRYLAQNINWGDNFSPFAASANNKFDFNAYSSPTNGSSPFFWNGNKTWATWRAIPQDANSSFSP